MMFRKNAGSYLHELMRLDAAVQQFTTALDKEETMVLEGHKAPAGIILNLVKTMSDFLVGTQTRAMTNSYLWESLQWILLMSDLATLQSGLLLIILRLVLEQHQCGSAIGN
jgi:hypothetical protein